MKRQILQALILNKSLQSVRINPYCEKEMPFAKMTQLLFLFDRAEAVIQGIRGNRRL